MVLFLSIPFEEISSFCCCYEFVFLPVACFVSLSLFQLHHIGPVFCHCLGQMVFSYAMWPHISSPCSQSGSCLLSTRTASPSPRQAGTRNRNQPPCQDNGRGLHAAGVQRILHSSRYLPAQASTPGHQQ